ncbi:MAG: hypothetical protein Q7W30_10690 [Coriobacteriia bacterium]|nr:hypothetical protein [Coriobacteriia bacterium]
MSGYRGHSIIRIAVLVALALALSGCAGGGDAAGPGAKSGGTAVPDTAKAVEKAIVAADGGALDVDLDDTRARVIFPQDALGKNLTIVATPLSEAPGIDAEVLVKGFLLEEKGTGAGPKLAYPAWVSIAVPKKLGDDVALVRYREDGGYDVLPTKVAGGPDGTVLTALVTHFSPVGAAKVGKSAADKAKEEFAQFNWVIFVRGSDSLQTGPIKQTIYLTLRAVNTSGDIDGNYTGTAQVLSKNNANMGGGSLSAPFSGSSKDVRITIIIGEIAPLTRPKPDTPEGVPLAPLTPEPDWSGSGTIKLTATKVAGTGTLSAGGRSYSKGVSNTSSVPVNILMWGPQVTLEAELPVGKVSFSGYVRGEGKK